MCTVPRTATQATPLDRATLTAWCIASDSATGPGAASASTTATADRSSSTAMSGLAICLARLEQFQVAREAGDTVGVDAAQVRPHQHVRDRVGVLTADAGRDEDVTDEGT